MSLCRRLKFACRLLVRWRPSPDPIEHRVVVGFWSARQVIDECVHVALCCFKRERFEQFVDCGFGVALDDDAPLLRSEAAYVDAPGLLDFFLFVGRDLVVEFFNPEIGFQTRRPGELLSAMGGDGVLDKELLSAVEWHRVDVKYLEGVVMAGCSLFGCHGREFPSGRDVFRSGVATAEVERISLQVVVGALASESFFSESGDPCRSEFLLHRFADFGSNEVELMMVGMPSIRFAPRNFQSPDGSV